MVPAVGPCTHMGDLEEAPGWWLQSSSVPATVGILEVNQWTDDLPLSLLLYKFTFRIKINFKNVLFKTHVKETFQSQFRELKTLQTTNFSKPLFMARNCLFTRPRKCVHFQRNLIRVIPFSYCHPLLTIQPSACGNITTLGQQQAVSQGCCRLSGTVEVKWLPAIPASHINASWSPSCCTSDLRPC